MYISSTLHNRTALCAVLLLASCSIVFSQTCGDCDRSGAVSITDSLRAAQIAVGILGSTPMDADVCDVDGSGAILVLDALLIAQTAAGLTPALSCPGGAVNQPPVASAVAAQAPLGADILVDYLLADAEGNSCSVDVTVSTDGGVSFPVTATQAPGGDGSVGLASSPGGTPHTWAWDSLADLGAALVTNVVVRITPSDPQPGTPGQSAPFVVDNQVVTVISYSMDIEPTILLSASGSMGCVRCHDAGSPARGLDLTTYAGLMAGGSSGASVVPGNPGNSLIICSLESGACVNRMPEGGMFWDSGRIQEFRDWILAGAPDN